MTILRTRPIHPLQAIAFDLDGTLVDTLPDLAYTMNSALAQLKLPPVPMRLIRQSLHAGLEGAARAAIARLHAPPALLPDLLRLYRYNYREHICRSSRPFPGVQAMLERHHQQGIKLGICTNKDESDTLLLLDTLGFLQYIEAVIGGDTLPNKKPAPDPLVALLAKLHVPIRAAVMVGDTHVDLECARAAGVPCALYSGGYGQITSSGTTLGLVFSDYDTLDLKSFHGISTTNTQV